MQLLIGTTCADIPIVRSLLVRLDLRRVQTRKLYIQSTCSRTDQEIPVIDIAAYGFVEDYSLYLHRRELIETGVREIACWKAGAILIYVKFKGSWKHTL